MYNQLGVIGCGLMGGSFALAMKKAGLVRRVVGYSKSPSTTETARRMGVIDIAAESALLAVSGSDIVLLAVPVAATESTLKAIRHLVRADVLLMDVGSTKGDVVDAAKRALGKQFSSFVPAHPIAGKESAGVQHADAALYQGRQVILTPLEQTRPEMVQKATDVWSALGCQVLKMAPHHHDEAFAAVSHLPHLLAYALVDDIAAKPHADLLFQYAASGFRDFTRIAGSSPEMWRDISLANQAALLTELDAYLAQLTTLRAHLAASDGAALAAVYTNAQRARREWIEAIEAGSPPPPPNQEPE